MNFIKQAWRGEVKLWKIFWLYGWLYPTIVGVFYHFLAPLIPLIKIPILILDIIYSIWWCVAAWRCAFNVRVRFWGYVARIYVALMPILFIGGVIFGAMLTGGKLVNAAECRLAKKIAVEKAVQAGIDPAQYYTEHHIEIEDCKNYMKTNKDFYQANSAAIHASTAPATSLPSPDLAREAQCRKVMDDTAIKYNVKPDNYFAQNQAYYQQCIHPAPVPPAATPQPVQKP